MMQRMLQKLLAVECKTIRGRNCHAGKKYGFPLPEQQKSGGIHGSASRPLPEAGTISLPVNVEELNAGEKAQFSPMRTRDINGPVIQTQASALFSGNFMMAQSTVTNIKMDSTALSQDEYVENFDCFGPVLLNSVMQTNVPDPFNTQQSEVEQVSANIKPPTHLNLPLGELHQQHKYISDDLQVARHHQHPDDDSNVKHTITTETAEESSRGRIQLGTGCHWDKIRMPVRFYILSGSPLYGMWNGVYDFTHSVPMSVVSPCRSIGFAVPGSATFLSFRGFKGLSYSSSASSSSPEMSQKEKFKRVVKEYGATVVVFHVCISLVSLGAAYLVVSSGLDVVSIFRSLGISENVIQSKIATGASTFVISYAVHKVFAPVRISITLTATPFIVRYLRRINFLKPAKRN